MASLGPGATQREWQRLRAAGVPTFARWAWKDARILPPSPVIPRDVGEERTAEVLAVLWRHVAACYRALLERAKRSTTDPPDFARLQGLVADSPLSP